MNKGDALKIYRILDKEYPGVTTELTYRKPYELLFATILSAQCTDVRVNLVTKELFKKYRSVSDFAEVGRPSLERAVRSTGFFRNKAANIIGSARMIEKEFSGEVPRTMAELLRLPGVARKTANIVLFHGFGITQGIAVDTHVKRISSRLGLTENTSPEKIEKDLMSIFKKENWGNLTNIFIAHGRKVCRARKPLCGSCPVRELCLFQKSR
ncbi:MAG: endonuclease III [Candidatus Omnitrophota bacterium]